ncbi:MAG: NUDIX hydrolase [Bacteroidaceae bacterium]|nr:NUDIX hydrolase [Bacteroidaceae bacterium]
MEDNRGTYTYRYPHPAVTADCVIFGFDGVSIKLLLIQRGIEPYKGKWAFPGGFMNMDETAEECAKRELEEETGLKDAAVEQFYTFSDVNRDPRERVITVAHYALVRLSDVKGGDDAASARWFAMDEVPSLAFDHDRIMRMAVNRLKERICFEPIGFEILPEVFTMTELQNLYEAILEVKFDRRNFYNKMLKLGILSEAEPRPANAARRTPSKYRFNSEKYAELKQKGFRLEF